ncbi:MAG: hypothetical protein LBS91_05500 [Clostridiales Family XIII bacterium]|jgi:preprotein translocase subunit SecG|nr:hypothetical protein [Clostridiales Family XIII bacterium]
MKTFARVSGVVAFLMIVLTLALAAPALAAGGTLELIKSTPENGNTRVPIENVGVKLFFKGDVTAESVWAGNKGCFSLTDSKGKEVPSSAYPGVKKGEEGYILVLAQPVPLKEGQPGQLAQKSDYKLTISGDLASADGAKLGNAMTIDFTTMDVAANSKLSMMLMVLMMVAVIALMFVTNWRKMKAEAEAAALMKANPYRIAKEKSITVDEAKALIAKAKEKNQKQLDKVGGKTPALEEKKSAVPRIESKKKKKNTHKVKGPRPISEGGGVYKTGRKAEKARKAKAAAVRKAASGGQKQAGSGAGKTQKGKSKKK